MNATLTVLKWLGLTALACLNPILALTLLWELDDEDEGE